MLERFDRITTDDGVRIRIREDGPANGPRLLLSNSLGTDLTMWEPQVRGLSAEYRIARYDTRGHGHSDVPEGNYSIERLGKDVLSVADSLGWDSFDFAGVSMGGMTGIWLAANAPERLNRLVMANGGPFAGGPAVWEERIAMVKASGLPAVVDMVIERWFTPEFASRDPETVENIRTVFARMEPAGYLGCCAALAAMDLRDAVPRLSTPMLAIGGAQDVGPPPAVIEAFANQVRGARCLIVPAAHLSNIEAADEFTAAMRDFLR